MHTRFPRHITHHPWGKRKRNEVVRVRIRRPRQQQRRRRQQQRRQRKTVGYNVHTVRSGFIRTVSDLTRHTVRNVTVVMLRVKTIRLQRIQLRFTFWTNKVRHNVRNVDDSFIWTVSDLIVRIVRVLLLSPNLFWNQRKEVEDVLVASLRIKHVEVRPWRQYLNGLWQLRTLDVFLCLRIEVERERKSSTDTTVPETKSSAKSVVIYFTSMVLGLIERIALVTPTRLREEGGEDEDNIF